MSADLRASAPVVCMSVQTSANRPLQLSAKLCRLSALVRADLRNSPVRLRKFPQISTNLHERAEARANLRRSVGILAPHAPESQVMLRGAFSGPSLPTLRTVIAHSGLGVVGQSARNSELKVFAVKGVGSTNARLCVCACCFSPFWTKRVETQFFKTLAHAPKQPFWPKFGA